MKEWYKLQFKMANRRFKDAGLEPILAYIILIAGFICLSIYLFYKTEYATYAYMLLSLSLTGKLSEIRRNEFLKMCFGNNVSRKIRITENLITAFPFLLFLCYKQLFLPASILLILAVLLALVNFRITFNLTIPTPFYRKPFEFAVGFRNTFYLFPVAYLLAFISVSVDNLNLGIFAMLFVFAITLAYHTKPENEYYVWSYNLSARQFLFNKIKTALLYSTLLAAPVILILGVSFYQRIDLLLTFLIAGYAFLICIIAAKYSAYPNEMSLMHFILIALSIYFPPLLAIIIPCFFYQSVTHLKVLLK